MTRSMARTSIWILNDGARLFRTKPVTFIFLRKKLRRGASVNRAFLGALESRTMSFLHYSYLCRFPLIIYARKF
jgi:hypothetical protein